MKKWPKLKRTHTESILECGTDEAGRGCLAGPVTAAAVILPPRFRAKVLNDSKQLTADNREEMRSWIEQKAVCFSVKHVFMDEIDQLNILNASILAMHRCIDALSSPPDFIAVDGNRFKPYRDIPHACLIKGDAQYLHIAAASILAKTYRDQYMNHIHKEYPMYNWKQNKGYPTKEHREAIRRYGLTPYHRKSFRQLPEQLELTL